MNVLEAIIFVLAVPIAINLCVIVSLLSKILAALKVRP
jgi:hypothetical protein